MVTTLSAASLREPSAPTISISLINVRWSFFGAADDEDDDDFCWDVDCCLLVVSDEEEVEDEREASGRRDGRNE